MGIGRVTFHNMGPIRGKNVFLMAKYVYERYIFCHNEDILIPYVPLLRECDPTYPNSGLSKGTYLTNKHNHFKEIRD